LSNRKVRTSPRERTKPDLVPGYDEYLIGCGIRWSSQRFVECL
jgi:hypothetical protein